MGHPNLATLALYAGGDLGAFARWRTERHVAACERCRAQVEAFERARRILPDLAEMPEVPWNRLAAEMKANIRLGLEAGECVRGSGRWQPEWPRVTSIRAAVALASVTALLVTGMVLERPAPVQIATDDGLVVQATGNGIQVRKGGQALRLMNPNGMGAGGQVTYSPDAEGSIRARYIDPQTGYVTINNVYAE
jgi:anti-sigma factor RsiW